MTISHVRRTAGRCPRHCPSSPAGPRREPDLADLIMCATRRQSRIAASRKYSASIRRSQQVWSASPCSRCVIASSAACPAVPAVRGEVAVPADVLGPHPSCCRPAWPVPGSGRMAGLGAGRVWLSCPMPVRWLRAGTGWRAGSRPAAWARSGKARIWCWAGRWRSSCCGPGTRKTRDRWRGSGPKPGTPARCRIPVSRMCMTMARLSCPT